MENVEDIIIYKVDEIIEWLVENYDDYYDFKNFLDVHFDYEDDMKIRAFKSVKYKEQLNFCFHYKTLKDILFLKNLDSDAMLLVDEYHFCKKNKGLLERWHNKVTEFLIVGLKDTYYSDTVVYKNNKGIGVKPFSSKIYDKNPFIISTEGFEGYIELMEIIHPEKSSNII